VPAAVVGLLEFKVIVPPSPEAPKVFRVRPPWLMTQLPEKPVPLAAAVWSLLMERVLPPNLVMLPAKMSPVRMVLPAV